MNLLQQPRDSSLCGQTCVAMLADITLEESIKVFSTKGGTRTRDVVKALTSLGIKCGDKLIRLSTGVKKPDLCIVKLHFTDDKNTHWTVWNNGWFYDPGCRFTMREYPEFVRETSFLPIFDNEGSYRG